MDKIKWKVLVFPGGTEIGLEIAKSLRFCKEIELFSASLKGENHATFFFRKNFVISDVRIGDWLFELNQLIEKESIDFIFPANPIIIDYLAEYRKQIRCEIVMTSNEVIEFTRSKNATLNLFENILPIPRRYKKITEINDWPVHIKPNSSYGSQGTRIVETKNELIAIPEVFNNFIIQENLKGEEYSVDCLSDQTGKLLFVGPRLRGRIRMGTTMHSYIIDNSIEQKLKDYANLISKNIKITGAWFFQVKSDCNGILKLLEVEARIAGTMCLNRVRGINFPLMHLFIISGVSIDIMTNDLNIILDRALVNRYEFKFDYDEVYVDLDDTIIVHNNLNLELIRFLYQCVNKNKKIILVSKSLEIDKIAFLKKWKIYQIFDEIYWLSESENKDEYIKSDKAIFIDDSFSQRKRVASILKIPTFDTSMVELLIDDRN